MRKRIVFLCVSAAWLLGTPAEAAEFHCVAGDVACLIDAINQSNANSDFNIIRLDPGTYSLTTSVAGPDSPAGLPQIVGSMNIMGGNGNSGPEATVIQRLDGLNFFRIFNVAGTGILGLANLTVAGGNPGGQRPGGAILSRGSVGIYFSIIRDNFATGGGAIEIRDGALSVIDSRIVNNGTFMLQGIIRVVCLSPCSDPPTEYPRTVHIVRSSIAYNDSGNGTSIVYIQDGWTLEIVHSDITGNRGTGSALILDGFPSSVRPRGHHQQRHYCQQCGLDRAGCGEGRSYQELHHC